MTVGKITVLHEITQSRLFFPFFLSSPASFFVCLGEIFILPIEEESSVMMTLDGKCIKQESRSASFRPLGRLDSTSAQTSTIIF